MRTLIRTNYSSNPQLEINGTDWTTFGLGAGAVGNSQRVVGAGINGKNAYVNTWSTAATGGGSSIVNTCTVSGSIGTKVSGSVWVYSNQSVSALVTLLYDGDLASPAVDTARVIPANEWYEITFTVSAPIAFSQLQIGGRISNLAGTQNGLEFRVTRPTLEIAPSVGKFFDGSFLETFYRIYKWVGTPYNSASQEYQIEVMEGFNPQKSLEDAKSTTINTILGPSPVMNRAGGSFQDNQRAALEKVLRDNALIQ